MNSLNKLVNQFPELGDLLAEYENRISYLENSLPYKEKEILLETKIVQPTNNEILEKLHRVEVLKNDLENRLNNHIDMSKKKGSKYK